MMEQELHAFQTLLIVLNHLTMDQVINALQTLRAAFKDFLMMEQAETALI